MKAIKILAIASILSALSIIPVFAAEKTYTVPVKDGYSSAKFTITYPIGSDYSITIIDPKEKEYGVSKLSETSSECVINEALKSGDWTVKIESSVEKAEEETSDENYSEDVEYQEDVIYGVDITFEGNTERILDVTDDNISVATDIANLKMYFKDDSFIAEWNDVNCGNVDIEVINEVNHESLDKQRVQGMRYELPIDEAKVSSIIVKIVPSTSSSMEGAETSKIYKVYNHPEATISYEDLTITNHEALKVYASLKQDYSLQLLNNGIETSHTEVLKAGDYEYEIPLEVGINTLQTFVIDSDNNMRSTSYEVEQDIVAPVLQLSKEYVQIQTVEESIDIEGKVSDYSLLTINEKPIDVEGDHTFKYTYNLKEGLNNINISAFDEAGNVSTYEASVVRVIPKKTPVPWDKIALIAVIIVCGIIYIRKSIIKNFKSDENTLASTDLNNSKNISGIKGKMPIKLSFHRPTGMKGLIADMLDILVPAIAIVIIMTQVLGITVIQSASMEPTLMTGNTVFLNRLAYKTGNEPQRGDVISFWSDEYNNYFGKRIIGIPGDIIEFKDGYVVINGQYVDESEYINENVETNCEKVFEVPEGCYFMLGDNRENSNDSRFWVNPYIEKDKIVGKYMGQIDFSIESDILKKL